jgi:hypothetical protein
MFVLLARPWLENESPRQDANLNLQTNGNLSGHIISEAPVFFTHANGAIWKLVRGEATQLHHKSVAKQAEETSLNDKAFQSIGRPTRHYISAQVTAVIKVKKLTSKRKRWPAIYFKCKESKVTFGWPLCLGQCH